ncbi:hypothetical protein SAMN02744133_10953 [Thalassospira xiamenensis M-5 = DSM 17429]|nr:hypothetical protein SAMN02744133_10953 [Thalassospira xiamenensis M-5 = DSM 17429]
MEESRNSILEVSFEKSVSKLIRKIYGSFLYNNHLHEETFNDPRHQRQTEIQDFS